MIVQEQQESEMQIWAELTKASGVVKYISNNSQNVRIGISADKYHGIHFAPSNPSGESSIVHAGDALKASSTLYVSYDENRMDQLGLPRGGSNPRVGPNRSISGFISFRGENGQDLLTVTGLPSVMRARIPEGTKQIQVWFSRYLGGRTVWDSNSRRNFVFQVN